MPKELFDLIEATQENQAEVLESLKPEIITLALAIVGLISVTAFNLFQII